MKKFQNNQKIIEIKHYLDNPSKSYECEFIQLRNNVILTKYISEEVNNLFSQNLVSYGFFWLKRNFISYSFYEINHSFHLASRYDICTETDFQQTPSLVVSFLDLYLDYWIKDGRCYWEDDKEYCNAKLNKIINQKQINIVEKTKKYLETNVSMLEKEKKKILFD
ncbi:MAG: hypothetical protein CL779_00520 [Chloroflexi bacterium]|nr:hypothetical protein [Chloroflexota bacterium]|tara:strand:+ start:1191 stop:1685 length:495 start_codon:yes stop_codon:yes gene_type:complete